MNKIHNRLTSFVNATLKLLFYVLVIIYTNICFANNSIKVAEINSFSRTDEFGLTVRDMRDGNFLLSFSTPKNDGWSLEKTEFTAIDSSGKAHIGKVVGDLENCNAMRVSPGEYYPCRIMVQFEKNNAIYSDYILNVITQKDDDKGKKTTDSTKARMPEFAVTLEENTQNINNKILKLKSVYSKPVTITEVSNGKYIEVVTDANLPAEVLPTKECKIHLNLNQQVLQANGSFTDKILIKYYLDGERLEAEVGISIKVSPSSVCSSGPIAAEALTLSAKKSPAPFMLTANNGQVAIYAITNNANENVPFKVSGISQPIYRDYSVTPSLGKNCGDSLAAGESCIVKLFIYPPDDKKIEQKLIVSSEKLSKPLEALISVDVESAPNLSPLRVTPIPHTSCSTCVNGSIESVIRGSVQSNLRLRYLLENTSNDTLTITSAKVDSHLYPTDPAFTINNYSQELAPHAQYELDVTFTPPQNWYSSELIGLNKLLVVSFKQGSPKNIWAYSGQCGLTSISPKLGATKIPILISQEK